MATLTRSFRSRRPTYIPTGLSGLSVMGFCNRVCDAAEETGVYRFKLDQSGAVEWEHILLVSSRRGLRAESNADGLITIEAGNATN